MRIALFAATAALVLVAAAPPARDRLLNVMHERHEGMETIGKTNKLLFRELQTSAPNLGTVRSGAAIIATLSSKALTWFPHGTGPELGKTGAKPEIWQQPQDFASKLHNFQAAAQAFNAAAKAGDLDATKGRYRELLGTCKACHDTYRSEMHH
jgi:cytochrome c556